MRYAHNPILSPEDLCPSQPSMQIECLLNPGVFRYDGKVWMLVRVAERPAQAEGEISFLYIFLLLFKIELKKNELKTRIRA